ncbi:MAG: isochorismatase family protein [Actinomycetales bacterium]|jgi:nicotinamidase-related amidase
MTVSTLDPATALIVIDLQKGILALPTVHSTAEVAARAAELARAFRSRGLPVVLVNVTGGAPGRTEAAGSRGLERPEGWADLVPELDRQPEDHVVTKQTWGAFHGTGLADLLAGLGVTQVVLAGVSTSIGVETTARSAFEHGFNITLAVDAMTDTDPDAHTNSVSRIFPRLGETGSTQEILSLLGNREK